MIALKIDVTKINKDKLFPGKNGAKYLDIVLIDREDDYGNHYMVVQSVSKEERLAGERGAILGNGKIIGSDKPAPSRASRPAAKDESDDCPF